LATDVEIDVANKIIADINAYIGANGGVAPQWYVGIASSKDRLFYGHGVSEQDDVWIYRTAPSSDLAREIEASFHQWGCKGGPGGGDYGTRMVYAYRITGLTRE
jgi:hypothetical protein